MLYLASIKTSQIIYLEKGKSTIVNGEEQGSAMAHILKHEQGV